LARKKLFRKIIGAENLMNTDPSKIVNGITYFTEKGEFVASLKKSYIFKTNENEILAIILKDGYYKNIHLQEVLFPVFENYKLLSVPIYNYETNDNQIVYDISSYAVFFDKYWNKVKAKKDNDEDVRFKKLKLNGKMVAYFAEVCASLILSNGKYIVGKDTATDYNFRYSNDENHPILLGSEINPIEGRIHTHPLASGDEAYDEKGQGMFPPPFGAPDYGPSTSDRVPFNSKEYYKRDVMVNRNLIYLYHSAPRMDIIYDKKSYIPIIKK